ncbi:hypothetical protein [Euzebya sp.]|uniref:hypothetical protein n=1 Tax=Euzebya sp. TaxID=1971409 RepID=UPI00351355C6
MSASTRGVVGVLLALVWAVVGAAPAGAHAVIQPASAPAGEPTRFQVLIPHGCSEGEPPPPPGEEIQPTRLVAVEIPDGVTVTDVEPADGFTESQGEGEITWSGGSLAHGDVGTFFFTATLEGGDGDLVVLNTYQECTDALAYRWIGDADAATPAPVVAIGTGAPAAGGHDQPGATDEPSSEDPAPAPSPSPEPAGGDGGPGIPVAVVAVLAGLGALAGGLVVRRRRRGDDR